jgi:oligopeptide/dipeptide ABC transporter ATP-binding protein
MSEPLLSVRELRTWFPIRRGIFSRVVGHVRAVDGIDLDIHEGETVGLVGESGCGKSTVARTLAQLEPYRSGTVSFRGRDLASLPRRARQAIRRSIQIVFQDPFSSLNPRMTIMDIVTEGLLANRLLKRRDQRTKATTLLASVGLGSDALDRYPHEFSGGQRQRVCIARALALKPELIICDEAVSALDVSVQAQVMNLLMELKKTRHLSYLFISHDLGVVRHLADRIAVMYLGRLVEEGPAEQIITSPRHPYTQALVSAIPRVGKRGRDRIVLQGDVPSPINPPCGCSFHPRCRYATEACQQAVPPLEPCGGSHGGRVACIHAEEIRRGKDDMGKDDMGKDEKGENLKPEVEREGSKGKG